MAGMKLRFTTRDLLWLTVVLAMASAMFFDHAAIRRELKEIEFERRTIERRMAQRESSRPGLATNLIELVIGRPRIVDEPIK